VIPKLPGDNEDLNAPIQRAPLIPGLEDSGGALYEIGVSDDGTLVGLTKDEMDESLTTLRVMAASLGCKVEVMRMVIVGECQWVESTKLVDRPGTPGAQMARQGKLWVAEAMVTPSFEPQGDSFLDSASQRDDENKTAKQASEATIPSQGSSTTCQVRITLTGPTTSGKSTLLGTLSTGTLDNGRGKSRLSLLKHRHEMVSGVTSSIAQELIGYKDGSILNFSHSNTDSWIDIHDRAENGRLLFVSDSGGHPRYRRTVLRGLMNWAPHWSILCIAADDSEPASNGSSLHPTSLDPDNAQNTRADLVMAHLTLSLKLDVPMAIVITKMDLASKPALQKTLVKVLTAIKDAGRTPKILQPDQKEHAEMPAIPPEDNAKVQSLVQEMVDAGSLTKFVPIALTSAMTGTGIGLIHALLSCLPLPPPPTSRDYVGMALNPEQPKSLFHIDDTYNLPISYGTLTSDSSRKQNSGIIVSGHIRFGALSVGDKIVVGPFPAGDDDDRNLGPEERPSPENDGLSISHPSSAELSRIAMKNAVSASEIAGEWLKAEVVSVRNLRLPVRTLEAGQAGSIGLVLYAGKGDSVRDQPRVRRGMVLAIPSQHMMDTGLSLQAASGFTAVFKDHYTQTLVEGSFVNIYVASVRAAARIVRVRALRNSTKESRSIPTDELEMFSLNEELDESVDLTATEVSVELLHNREWIELGSQVILLEGGARDRSGLEGFVGKVLEIID
jgi:GTPase